MACRQQIGPALRSLTSQSAQVARYALSRGNVSHFVLLLLLPTGSVQVLQFISEPPVTTTFSTPPAFTRTFRVDQGSWQYVTIVS